MRNFGNIPSFHGRGVQLLLYNLNVNRNNQLHHPRPSFTKKWESRGKFTIGSFEFSLREEEDFGKYVITRNDVSFPFHILTIDISKERGAHSNLNLVEFISDY